MEQHLLHRMPEMLLGNALALWLLREAGHLAIDGWAVPPLERLHALLDYLVLGVAFTAAMAFLTVGIGCGVVRILKGHRYEADPYPVVDATLPDHPPRP